MNKRKRLLWMYRFALIFVVIVVVSLSFLKTATPLLQEETLIEKQMILESTFSDSKGYTFHNPNVVVNPYGNSPLTALVIFETDQAQPVKVTVKGKDPQTTYSKTYAESTVHFIEVLGLYANHLNEVVIEVDGQEKVIEIQTDPLPDNVYQYEYLQVDKSKLGNDLYFFTPSSDALTCAYDLNGDVRWYLTNTSTWKIDRLDNGRLLLGTERLVNPPYYNTGLYEMDMLGKIYVEYTIDGGYHHDYVEMENGNLLIASSNFEDATVEDYIVEIDRTTAEVVKEIDLKDILNTDDGKNENWVEYDWFHNNSVWYDKNSNSITLSGRHQDAVVNIDYDTLQLNWIIGDPTNYSEEYLPYFFTPVSDEFEWQYSQHAAMITPENEIFILDNGNNKSKIESEYVKAEDSYTRGVLYQINTKDMTIKQVWQYGKERGSSFYSPYVSDVDYLGENHYIVHSGGIVYVDGKISNSPAGLTDVSSLKSTTVELLNDEVIFEITLPSNTYRVEKMSMYGNEEFSTQPAVRIGSFEETKPISSGFEFMFTNEISNEYLERNLQLTKEIDRLVVSGDFKVEDEVEVILKQGFDVNRYEVRISDTPYTAMCVLIFSDDDKNEVLEIDKYINQTGLDGVYEIFIKLNGVTYQTNQSIEFE